MVKKLLNALWLFCSYLFWPQWRKNKDSNNNTMTYNGDC